MQVLGSVMRSSHRSSLRVSDEICAAPDGPKNSAHKLTTAFCYTCSMKLIFIYGPPAAGKLTIAEKLSEATGIAVFHNHHSRDIVKDIYGDELMQHYDLVDTIRFDVLEYCAQHDTDLIFTYVYGGPDDDVKVKGFTEKIESNGGSVHFVELTANAEDLINRVDNESRKRFKKLTDKEIMAKLLEDVPTFSIPYVDALKINTSDVSPDEAVSLIVDQLHLR